MARARKTESPGYTRLLEAWSPDATSGRALGCIATTFTFDAEHFEEQCLARFLAMESDPQETTRTYLIEREEKLSETFVCVLTDPRHCGNEETRSLRWNVLPVRTGGAGLQHAKVSLLVWQNHVRVLIASANLTKHGYRSNLEMAAILDFRPDEGEDRELLFGTLDFLTTLAGLCPGADQQTHPRSRLLDFIRLARTTVRAWPAAPASASRVKMKLVPLVPGSGDKYGEVLRQLENSWQGPMPNSATIVSPFYDVSNYALDRVHQRLENLLTNRGNRRIEWVGAGREGAKDRIEIDVPERLVKPPQAHASLQSLVYYINTQQATESGDSAQRPLHAKCVFLERDDVMLMMLGSSNFTLKGLGLTAQHNLEMNIAYVVPAMESSFGRKLFEPLNPLVTEVDMAHVDLISTNDSSEEPGDSTALLPRGFDDALYEPQASGGTLILSLIKSDLPADFSVSTPTRQSLVTRESWELAYHMQETVRIPLLEPISGLRVEWRDADGKRYDAIWPVNVSDATKLIPPAELRNLSLEDLLIVLSSRRPLHWALAERLSLRADSATSTKVVVDPHAKVDTSNFLLKRMRRLAYALEGVRSRLDQSVASAEALHWRIHGPVGPVALGRALQAEGGTGAAFLIAEVCELLKEIRWNVASKELNAQVASECQAAVEALREIALGEAGQLPGNLSVYVRDVFARTTP